MRHDRAERFSVSTYFSPDPSISQNSKRNIRISVMNSFLLSSTSQHCQHCQAFSSETRKYKNVLKNVFQKVSRKNTQNTAAQWEKSLIYFSFCITEPNPDVTKHKNSPLFNIMAGSFVAQSFFFLSLILFFFLLFRISKDSFLPLCWIYCWHTILLCSDTQNKYHH